MCCFGCGSTRLLQTAGDRIAYQIAADPHFATVIVAGTHPLTAGTDNTVKVPLTDSALAPFTSYYFRFIYNGVASRTGRFKTLPTANADLAEINLGFVVCQDYGNGYYAALAHLAQEQVDFVVHLGDYIYETITSNFLPDRPSWFSSTAILSAVRFVPLRYGSPRPVC